MVSELRLYRLTAAIYEAALEPSRWPDFLEQLAEALHGELTAIFVHDFRSLDGTTVWTTRSNPDYIRRYNEHYHTKNIYVTQRPEIITVGRVLESEELCPEREVLRSEYYAEWLRPQDLFWTTGGALLKEDSVTAIVTSLRPHRALPFGKDDVALQRALFPHLHRALQVQRRLQGLDRIRDAASAILDRLPVGIVLLDEFGQVLTVNLQAREILDQADGLTLALDGLTACLASETEALRRALQDARQTALGNGLVAGRALRLTRPSSKRPLSVVVAPLSPGRIGMGVRTATVGVFVSDPERVPTSPPETLAVLYGLTPAESRLVAALAEGKTPTEAAEQLHVTVETVRTQIKRILAKTETSRQSDLVRMVLGSPAFVRHD